MKTNKEEILNAALTVFSQKGYDGALLRDISACLGITKPALYKHYESKPALYKHYESKQALWNAMIDYVERYYSEHIHEQTVNGIRFTPMVYPKSLQE